MNQQVVLDRVTVLIKNEFSESLIGIYLHGSMAMGCFNPLHSDIDILVLVQQGHSKDTYKRLAKQLIHLEEELNIIKGFELSVVLQAYAVEFVYPTPFEFHYSSFHKERYLMDANYFCGGYADSDLAAHFVVTYERGIVLFGKPIKEAFTPIDIQYYVDSIKSDVDGALEEIVDKPIYYVLNLSRVLQYLREEVIASKKEAGEWALVNLPDQFKPIIAQCLKQYERGIKKQNFDERMLLNYTKYMLKEIEKEVITLGLIFEHESGV